MSAKRTITACWLLLVYLLMAVGPAWASLSCRCMMHRTAVEEVAACCAHHHHHHGQHEQHAACTACEALEHAPAWSAPCCDDRHSTEIALYTNGDDERTDRFLASVALPVSAAEPLSEALLSAMGRESFGLENLTRTPQVVFARNTVRHNRARGALFSTPRRVEVVDNLFDHTSGSAILLCGDCNGWFETGACRDVWISRNRFVNALTSHYQFTEAVISIYPEIPDLAGQRGWFHSGIVVEDNEFDTFDVPVLYAKSVDGLIFRRNVIRPNSDYAPYHAGASRIRLERVTNAKID